MASGYQLYYFDIRGRAEVCRLSFAAANIKFEDVRLKGEEWVKEKESGRPPLGQMPFIVLPGGKVLGQSGAIMKYICKTAGLAANDIFDEAIAEMISDGVSDLRTAFLKAKFETDEAKKDQLNKEFLETTLPARLDKYSKLLESRNKGEGFFLDKLTYADIAFFDFFNSSFSQGEPRVPTELQKFPVLVQHYNRVLNVPKIKDWVEKRPKTTI